MMYTKTIKKIIVIITLFLLGIELYCGTLGGVRFITFGEQVSGSDFIANESINIIREDASQVVFQLVTDDSTWSVGVVCQGGSGNSESYIENQVMDLIATTEDSNHPGKMIGENVEFQSLHLYQIEVHLPYIGGWKTKKAISRLEKDGLIEECSWSPFFMMLATGR